MSAKMRGERELHWRVILDRQANSGLSIRRFCASEGISEPTFYAWRRKLAKRPRNGSRPGTADRRQNGPDNRQLFVPLQLIDAAPTLEIVHPLGYRIHVRGDVDPVALRHVIDTLDGRGTP